MSLVSRLLEILTGRASPSADDGADDPDHLAAAALLVHVARADGFLNDPERQRLVALLGRRFALHGDEAERFVARAEAVDRETDDVATLVAVVGRDLDRSERQKLLGLAYGVAAADGAVHEFEDDLVWRLGRLLGFDDGEIAGVREGAVPLAASARVATGARVTGART
jgi:uncharacterized tellurite resistance protein B-like protein